MSDDVLNPIMVNHETWMFPEKRGLCVVREVRANGRLIQTEVFHLPWAKVRHAVAIRDGKQHASARSQRR